MELLIEEDNPAVGYYANGLKIVKERVDYIKEKDDKKLWLVNPSGYDYLIGDKGSTVSEISFLIALAGLITIIASIFSYEKKSDMERSINTTKSGRKRVKRRKYVMIYGLCTLMWLIICIMEIYTVLNIYALDGLQAPIQSLAYMANVPFNISIGGYLIVAYISVNCYVFCHNSVCCGVRKNEKSGIMSVIMRTDIVTGCFTDYRD